MDAVAAACVLFLGLQPDVALSELVFRHKRRVEALVGNQMFLHHPPHMTVYLAAFDDPQAVQTKCAAIAEQMPMPDSEIVGWHVFAADVLTGAYTLVLQLSERDQATLRDWQRDATAALAPLRNATATRTRYRETWQSLSAERQRAVEQVGFPFIGDDWYPHWTIASIAADAWPVVERELLAAAPRMQGVCPQAALYRLQNEYPVPMASFPLRSRVPKPHFDAQPVIDQFNIGRTS
jgi:hypothetical protein